MGGQGRGVAGAQVGAPGEVLAVLCFRWERVTKARTRERSTKGGRIMVRV